MYPEAKDLMLKRGIVPHLLEHNRDSFASFTPTSSSSSSSTRDAGTEALLCLVRSSEAAAEELFVHAKARVDMALSAPYTLRGADWLGGTVQLLVELSTSSYSSTDNSTGVLSAATTLAVTQSAQYTVFTSIFAAVAGETPPPAPSSSSLELS